MYVWQRLLRIFANYFLPLVFTWGMVVWTSLVRDVFHYDNESMNHGFYTIYGSVHTLQLLLPLVFSGVRKEVQPVWEILSSTIVYHIWKARCSLVFHQLKIPPVEVVSNIWLDMVHTLSQWDGIVGDSEAKIAHRSEVLIWTTTRFLTSNFGTSYWHF